MNCIDEIDAMFEIEDWTLLFSESKEFKPLLLGIVYQMEILLNRLQSEKEYLNETKNSLESYHPGTYSINIIDNYLLQIEANNTLLSTLKSKLRLIEMIKDEEQLKHIAQIICLISFLSSDRRDTFDSIIRNSKKQTEVIIINYDIYLPFINQTLRKVKGFNVVN